MHKIPELAKKITQDLSQIEGIQAIVLGGSHARQEAHADSDIDIGIYYHPDNVLSIREIRSLAAELDDTHATNLITPLGEWGKWINGGGWLKVKAQAVDFLFRDLRWVSQVVTDCREGKITCDYQPGHPHGFHNYIYLAEVFYGITLYDPHGIFNKLKEKIKKYPPLMKKAIIYKYLWEAEFSLTIGNKAIKRNDVFYLSGCLFRSVACLIQVLFALNEHYFMNEKGAMRIINNFKVVPINFISVIENVLSQIGASSDLLFNSIHQIQELIGSVKVLVENEI